MRAVVGGDRSEQAGPLDSIKIEQSNNPNPPDTTPASTAEIPVWERWRLSRVGVIWCQDPLPALHTQGGEGGGVWGVSGNHKQSFNF